jgi:leader peptidase (prepilin peptidase) / N-methyltransferase
MHPWAPVLTEIARRALLPSNIRQGGRQEGGFLTMNSTLARTGAPLGLAVLGGAAVVATAHSTRSVLVTAAVAVAVAALTVAACVDLRERRLPDELVGSGGIAMSVLLVTDGRWGVLGGSLLLAGPILLVHLVNPAHLGFGDVKAAAVLGAVLGVFDPVLALVALALGAGGAAAWGLARRQPTVAFGTALVAGTSAVVVGSVVSGIVTSGMVAGGAV